MSVEKYESDLAAWKARHGVIQPGGIDDPEELMALEDAKRPGNCYCMGCAEEFPIAQMRLITRRDDPYLQFDDDGETQSNRPDWYIKVDQRVRMCRPCFKEKYEDDTESP